MTAALHTPPAARLIESGDADDGVSRPQLRQADWRYLLPSPAATNYAHVVLRGGPDGLDQQLLNVGFARRVTRAMPTDHTADAVILLDGAASRAALTAAAQALAPGGVLYCEVDRRAAASMSLTPAALRRVLRGLGLEPAGLYWPLPNFAACKRYVPVDTTGAFRWYATTLHTSASIWQHVLKAGLRLVTGGYRSRAVGRLLPWYAMTATAGQRGDQRAEILRNPAYPAPLRDPALRPLLLTSGQDDGSRVIVLPFDTRTKQPLAVLKVARLQAFNINIEGEQNTLAELRARLDEPLRRGIPKPLGVYTHGAVAVGVETCARGQSLFDANIRWRATATETIDNLRVAANWLTQFHLQTQTPGAESGVAALRERAASVVERYAEGFGSDAAEQLLFSRTLAAATALTPLPLPLPFVRQHNDFGPWNLYRAGTKLTVIDWEFGWGPGFDRFGPPACDLLYLITHWSYSARKLFTPTAELRGFRQLFLARDAADDYIAAARDVLDAYLAALAIDRRLVPVLLVYAWADRAVKRLDRKRLLGVASATPRASDRFVAYVELLANDADTLFGSRPSQLLADWPEGT
jgi:hypothetical protein